MKKICVTGGCGFIGANLVPKLAALGYCVTIFDNLSHGKQKYIKEIDKFAIIEGDIRDQNALDRAINNHDSVIHLAAYGSVIESVASPEENFSVNVVGTFNVLNAAHKANVTQLIFASTGGALIGNTTPPVNENSIPKPISPYGASKLAGEAYCCAFSNSYGISVTALRFANVIGPLSWHKKGAMTTFIKAIQNNSPIHIYGDGSATRDFLYVDDLCSGIILALQKKLPGFNVMHLASGREVSVRELACLVRNVALKPEHPILFHQKRTGEVERNFASSDLAKSKLGFEPAYTLENAVELTYKWFQDYIL